MDDLKKLSIEELINSYLDGELSARQKTQAKRIIDHDPQIAKRVKELSRQRDLLAALPREKAPEHLLDDIKSRLERKVLLNEYIATDDNHKSLIMRHISSLAAAIVLVFGLGLVIWQVVSPVKPVNSHRVSLLNDDITLQKVAVNKPEIKKPPQPVLLSKTAVFAKKEVDLKETEPEITAAKEPLTTILDIKVSNIVTANKILAQAIYSNSLLDEVMVKHSNTNIEYTISAPARRVAAFFSKAKPLWPISKENRLILDRNFEITLDIDNVTYSELQEFILRSNEESLDDFVADIKLSRELKSNLSSLGLVTSQCSKESDLVDLSKQTNSLLDISLPSKEPEDEKKLSFRINLSEEN